MPNIYSSELLSWTGEHAVWLEWHRHNDCSVGEPNSTERVIRFDLELVGVYWLVALAYFNAEPDSDTTWQGHRCNFVLSLFAHSPRYARTARRTGNLTFFSCVFNTKQRPWLWRMRSSGYFSLVVVKEVTLCLSMQQSMHEKQSVLLQIRSAYPRFSAERLCSSFSSVTGQYMLAQRLRRGSLIWHCEDVGGLLWPFLKHRRWPVDGATKYVPMRMGILTYCDLQASKILWTVLHLPNVNYWPSSIKNNDISCTYHSNDALQKSWRIFAKPHMQCRHQHVFLSRTSGLF